MSSTPAENPRAPPCTDPNIKPGPPSPPCRRGVDGPSPALDPRQWGREERWPRRPPPPAGPGRGRPTTSTAYSSQRDGRHRPRPHPRLPRPFRRQGRKGGRWKRARPGRGPGAGVEGPPQVRSVLTGSSHQGHHLGGGAGAPPPTGHTTTGDLGPTSPESSTVTPLVFPKSPHSTPMSQTPTRDSRTSTHLSCLLPGVPRLVGGRGRIHGTRTTRTVERTRGVGTGRRSLTLGRSGPHPGPFPRRHGDSQARWEDRHDLPRPRDRRPDHWDGGSWFQDATLRGHRGRVDFAPTTLYPQSDVPDTPLVTENLPLTRFPMGPYRDPDRPPSPPVRGRQKPLHP